MYSFTEDAKLVDDLGDCSATVMILSKDVVDIDAGG